MDYAGILDAITKVGFPIVISLIMMYYIKYITESHKAEIEEITSKHKDEMVEITKAVENNTLALTKLSERLAKGDRENDT